MDNWEAETLNISGIVDDSIVDGPGLRYTIFVQGCPHGCPECHNPVTWDIRGGIPFDQAAKDELFEELKKDYVSGVTLSGGDPLHPDNREETGRLIDEICDRFPGKTIWLYTGYDWEEICGLPCIRKVDVVVDGEFVAGLKDSSLRWKGSSNQRVIDVQRSLLTGAAVIHDRS